MYNRAMFRDNGGCGFVEKPDFLRIPTIPYVPISPCGLSSRYPPWRVKIAILGGQHLPKPALKKLAKYEKRLEPYVKVY